MAAIRDTPPGLVAAVFSGHHHGGGYATDIAIGRSRSGGGSGSSSKCPAIHYVTAQSPLTHHAKRVADLKPARHSRSLVRPYDNPHVAGARQRRARAEQLAKEHGIDDDHHAVPCTATVTVTSEASLAAAAGKRENDDDGGGGDDDDDEYALAPFATVHVHEHQIRINGRGALPSRILKI
jgi:hypothetical protein